MTSGDDMAAPQGITKTAATKAPAKKIVAAKAPRSSPRP
jgi:hypothetical protein